MYIQYRTFLPNMFVYIFCVTYNDKKYTSNYLNWNIQRNYAELRIAFDMAVKTSENYESHSTRSSKVHS